MAPYTNPLGDKKAAARSRQERERIRRIRRFLLLFLVLVAAFVLGFFVRSQTAFIASLGIPLDPSESATVQKGVASKSTYDAVSARVSEVEDLLADNSLDVVDIEDATYTMLDGLLAATGDPYAAYFTPDRYVNYIKETADRSYAGVGVLFAEYNGRAYAADVFEGSEAQARGVRQGDCIMAIDGDRSKTWSLTEVVNTLARDEGSQVVITWMRPSSADAETGEEFTTTLACKTYQMVNCTTELHGTCGVIKLRQITQNSSELVKQALIDLSNAGATSFVLDLRGNPGGYLTQAVDIASLFVNSGVIVEIETVDGTTTKNAAGVRQTEAPLAVLVDGYTAASAEVLTAALQDNQRAEVVGQTTLGKGSVQVVRELSFGGAIRYTAAYYLTPLGHEINGVGIVPNIAVDSSEQVDAQLLVAIDAVSSSAS